jgi:hypothetical protein
MQKKSRFAAILAVILIAVIVGSAGAYQTPESIVAADKVYVSGATYDPAVFFPGDKGTLTVDVTNGNTDRGIVINHATLSSDTIKATSSPYDSSTSLGPSQKQSFIFTVNADGLDGTYYPTFSVSFRDADSLYYRAMVRIDDSPLVLTILDKPDSFSQGKKKTIYAQVANPRENTVKNVILDVSGTGISTSPSRVFVGSIAPGAKVPVNFTVTADQPTTVKLLLNYDNGDNTHTVDMELPITFGDDKKQANPVISNVLVKNEAGIYHITGDVNNAGLETANTVTVTALSPAVPQDPYKTYVVGALKPDDFGSFEVTFQAAKAESVPLQVSYKDTDGNVYDTVQDVKISSTGTTTQAAGNGPPIVPIAAGIALLIVFVGGWVYYLRRNRQ